MKKILPILMILIFLLSACTAAPKAPDPAAESGEQSGFSSDPAQSASSGEQESSGSEIPEEPGFLEKLTLREGSSSLYEVPLPFETQGIFGYLRSFGDQLLFVFYTGGWEEGYTLELYLVETEHFTVTASAQTEKTEGLPSVQVLSGKIILSDPGGSEIRIYNGDLSLSATYETEGAQSGEAHLGGDLRSLYRMNTDREITKTNLVTGQSEKVAQMGVTLGMDASGTQVLFSLVDPETDVFEVASLSLLTGEIEKMPFYCSSYWQYRCGDLWLSSVYMDTDLWYLGNGTDLLMFRSESMDKALVEPGRVLDTDDNVCTLYGPDGSFLDRISLREKAYHSDFVWLERFSGYLFNETTRDGAKLLFWQPDPTADGPSLPVEPVPDDTVLPGTAVSADLYERAAAIGEQYGIEILIADQCETEPSEFVCDLMLDEGLIGAGLDAVERVLVHYPDGFFSQLSFGYYPKVRMELVSALRRSDEAMPDNPDDANGFTSVAAFVDSTEGKGHLMVLDIDYHFGLDENIFHEFSHIIDQRLAWDSLRRDDALYSEDGWLACCPEGFSYAYDYFYLPDSVFDEELDGYFVDLYARTFPTEDRARIMEYAMADPEYVAERPGLLGKLIYYSACIRDSFDTAGWPETAPWETAIGLAGETVDWDTYAAEYEKAA